MDEGTYITVGLGLSFTHREEISKHYEAVLVLIKEMGIAEARRALASWKLFSDVATGKVKNPTEEMVRDVLGYPPMPDNPVVITGNPNG